MNGFRIARDLIIALLLGVVAIALIAFTKDRQPEQAQTELDEKTEDIIVHTGLSGRVLVGPQCPVAREGEDCPDIPYMGIVDIVIDDPEHELIARVRTDTTGVFSTALPAGEYVVLVQTESVFPLCEETPVDVLEGEVSVVAIVCDSGIR